MNPFKCKNCKDEFGMKESLKEHMLTAHNDKNEQFTCAICSKKFKARGSYMDHLQAHTNVDVRHECTLCPCFFKNPGHLKNHMDEVHGTKKKTFRCKVCKNNYDSRAELHAHTTKKHKDSELVLVKCSFCNRVYASKHSLKWHVHINHNKDYRRSQCPYCPSDFKWPHHLKVHIRKAHIEKGHAPSDLIKSGLSSIRRKTNDCVVCDEKFQKKLDLMLHLKKAHKQELDIYTCCICPAVFSLRNSLILHLEEHKKKKTDSGHICDQCHPEPDPKPFVIDDQAEEEAGDNRTEIEKEIIDFEITLMEDEDIRKLIKYRVRHERRKQIHADRKKMMRLKYDSEFEEDVEFTEIIQDDNVSVNEKDDVTLLCEKCNKENCICDQMVMIPDNTDETEQAMDEEVKVFLDGVDLNEDANALEYKCEICHCPFTLTSSLEEHMKLHAIEDNNEQSKETATKELRKRTKRNPSPLQNNETKVKIGIGKGKLPKNHQCRICPRKFNRPINLERHIKLDHEKSNICTTTVYECIICKTSFVHSAQYANHMRFNHKDKSKKKDKLKKIVKKKILLSPKKPTLKKDDVKTATSVPVASEKCGKCDVFFSTKLELLRHISDVHMALTPKNLGIYWCHKCNIKFTSKNEIEDHFNNDCT